MILRTIRSCSLIWAWYNPGSLRDSDWLFMQPNQVPIKLLCKLVPNCLTDQPPNRPNQQITGWLKTSQPTNHNWSKCSHKFPMLTKCTIEETLTVITMTTTNPASCKNPHTKDKNFLAAVFRSSFLFDFNICHNIDTMLTHVMTAINSLALYLS